MVYLHPHLVQSRTICVVLVDAFERFYNATRVFVLGMGGPTVNQTINPVSAKGQCRSG